MKKIRRKRRKEIRFPALLVVELVEIDGLVCPSVRIEIFVHCLNFTTTKSNDNKQRLASL